MLWARLPPWPLAAQVLLGQLVQTFLGQAPPAPSSGPACRPPGSWRASGICPPVSKASETRSTISCTVEGANTRIWKSPWPGGSGGLPVVRLGGLDAAQARAAALDVDDQRRAGRNPPYRRSPRSSGEMPGEEEEVMARTPAEAAPSTILMAAISDSAWR